MYRDAFRDLVLFLLFEKREKHSWKNNTSLVIEVAWQPATLLKVKLLHGCFSCYFNSTDGTKSCKASLFFPKIYQKY